MKHQILPMWLIRFGYFNPWIFQMGFFVGFLALLITAYKVRQGDGSEFKRRFLHIQYTALFWTGANTLFYHPYYASMTHVLFAIPMLIAQVRLAWYMIKKYGIGGWDRGVNE